MRHSRYSASARRAGSLNGTIRSLPPLPRTSRKRGSRRAASGSVDQLRDAQPGRVEQFENAAQPRPAPRRAIPEQRARAVSVSTSARGFSAMVVRAAARRDQPSGRRPATVADQKAEELPHRREPPRHGPRRHRVRSSRRQIISQVDGHHRAPAGTARRPQIFQIGAIGGHVSPPRRVRPPASRGTGFEPPRHRRNPRCLGLPGGAGRFGKARPSGSTFSSIRFDGAGKLPKARYRPPGKDHQPQDDGEEDENSSHASRALPSLVPRRAGIDEHAAAVMLVP